MNRLVYFIFFCVFCAAILGGHVNRMFGLIPEAVSAIVLCVVLLRLAVYREMAITPKYIFLGLAVVAHMLLGVVINGVEPGTIVAGLRPYLKWVPVFFLPIVYAFKEDEIRNHMKVLLFIALLQCPIALYQRFILYRGIASGDAVTGTFGFGASGALSIYLVSTIAVVIAYFIKGKLSPKTVIFLMVILFLPTTINETKVTIFLLPIAIAIPYIYASKKISVQQLIGISTAGILVGTGFMYIYNFVGNGAINYNGSFAGAGGVEGYLYSGKDRDLSKDNLLGKNMLGNNMILPEEAISSDEGGGRLDKISLAFHTLLKDPVMLWVGLGVGNVSTSQIKIFSGEYSERLGDISGDTLLSFLLWETGIGGVILFAAFIGFLIMDTRMLAKSTGVKSIWASGWMGVLGIACITIPYINVFYFNPLIFIFAYCSGHMVAQRAKSTEKVPLWPRINVRQPT